MAVKTVEVSKKWSWGSIETKKMLKGMAIAGGGAALVAISDYLGATELGTNGAIAAAVVAVLINIFKLFAQKN